LWVAVAGGADLDEFKVKRRGPFEFAEKPGISREGDRITVRFKARAFCDATVAIEDGEGRIIRHLASGVLGENAPAPFRKDSLSQEIVWDSKYDQGRYVDDRETTVIRVSLGLKARFERHFLWSPHRRIGRMPPIVCARPEGVYVFGGHGVDSLRLFDHAGVYVRTVYPFPAARQGELVGVRRHTFPQSGATLPLKQGFYETTLLTAGFSGIRGNYMLPRDGAGATAMAVQNGRIALACLRLNRLATDGSTGRVPLEGPSTSFTIDRWYAVPRSAGLSPDGKTLYLTGFAFDKGYDHGNHQWVHGVGKLDLLSGKKMEVFAGSLTLGKQHGGSAPGQFKSPSSVDCDAGGRVYVADHFNDRIQVFNPSGKHLKSVSIFRPSEVCVDQRTGHIYVFSWMYHGQFYTPEPVKPVLTHLGPFENPRRIASYPLPMKDRYTEKWLYADRRGGFQYRAAIDSWAPGDAGPMVWLVPGGPVGMALAAPGLRDSALPSRFGVSKRGRVLGESAWVATAVKAYRMKGDKLELLHDFGRQAAKAMLRPKVPGYWRYRLYVRPTTGRLYVLDRSDQPIRIDPETGEETLVTLPFSAEDMAFDINGLAYLRTHREIVRYDPKTWREVPFDYGEERANVGLWNGRKARRVLSAVPIPTRDIWHQGGLWVSPKGHLAVAFYNKKMISGREKRGGIDKVFASWKPWMPQMFPGRMGHNIVRVWDKYGKVVYEDAARGLGITDGIAIDKDDNLYLLAAATRVLDGKRYWDYMTGTLFKVAPNRKVWSGSRKARIPLPSPSDRPADLADGGVGPAWVEDARWFYGGLAFTGKDGSHAAGGCACWNARFAHDPFARSFVPETQHYTVAVLDTNGNLILRIGRYGNVDDGVPLSKERTPGSWAPKPLGGDEVALFYPVYLATHSDRRLFIADPGNARIVSVKLGYEATETMALKDGKE
jgi:hypothetical protein